MSLFILRQMIYFLNFIFILNYKLYKLLSPLEIKGTQSLQQKRDVLRSFYKFQIFHTMSLKEEGQGGKNKGLMKKLL